ncbi:diamine N-acetyltransferase [Promicromonospora umidemergens]|uniref:GNAT family N-acetyltransferase n=1 Tax=Promicromonospora umidemergens TaxID=629679 RepID=A0ABP8WUJ7_9MICO|nr:GNAT family N-acetyltransferase [Promicromonospora umidemergens]MCP2283615.1 diamine N-acetyltransferase [Promicromonospora umidemergens]
MADLQLAELTVDNLPAALRLPPQADDVEPVSPVAWSVAEAYVNPTAWPRVVLDGDEVVGFVMANWSPDEQIAEFRAGIWRLNVARAARMRGVGRFAVEQVAAEARRRGLDRITVLWVPGPDGPEEFYLRCGFRKTGNIVFDQVAGELLL